MIGDAFHARTEGTHCGNRRTIETGLGRDWIIAVAR